MAPQESFPNLPISVQVLDGMPLAQQAAVYSNASIVIQAHGAALGEPSLPNCAGAAIAFMRVQTFGVLPPAPLGPC